MADSTLGRDVCCVGCLPGDQTFLGGVRAALLTRFLCGGAGQPGPGGAAQVPSLLPLALSSQSPGDRGGAGGSSWQKEGLQFAEEPRPHLGALGNGGIWGEGTGLSIVGSEGRLGR